MDDKTHVVGQLQGYLLQVRHMLFELISVDKRTVSLELYDDVAVQKNETFLAEQLKSVTSDDNPTTDHSVVLWKTFFNWLTYILNGSISAENTQFQMVVSASSSIKAGSLICQFHEASTDEEAQKSISNACLKLWGENNIKRNKIPDTYSNYVEALFSPNNREIFKTIIKNFKVTIHNNDYDEKLLEKFSCQLIPQEFVYELLIHMLGWVTEEVNKYLKNGKPAIIGSEDYRKVLTAQCRIYNQDKIIPRLSTLVSSDSINAEAEKHDTYIQQLDLIEQEYDVKIEAASDYLQTKAEIISRSEKGVLTSQTLDEYREKIFRIWANKNRQVLLLDDNSDIKKGQKLYYQMCESVIGVDNSLPAFFGSGTLHTMANEPRENPKIGWHPKYKEILNGGKKDE